MSFHLSPHFSPHLFRPSSPFFCSDPSVAAPHPLLHRPSSPLAQHGSYLLIERAKIITYRNFFKRVNDLQKARSPLAAPSSPRRFPRGVLVRVPR